MDKVDQFINDLAEHISNILKTDNEYHNDVAEKSRVLATLIIVRAVMSWQFLEMCRDE